LKKYLNQNIDCQYFINTDSFLNEFKINDFRQEAILLKGARAFQFERIADRLTLKAHKTVMEVNLNALRHNLNTYTRYLNPGTKLLAMVKAYAYGSGSAEVAKLLEFLKIDYLGVAYADEGVAIRKEGVTLPILVLNPEESAFDTLVRYRLEPEIYSLSQAQLLFNYVQHIHGFKVHIKLDTGMHRLGFEANDIADLLQLLSQNTNIKVASIFSHLAGSEATAHDDFTVQQFNRFTQMSNQIIQHVGYQPIRHILNSGGINRHTAYQMDMVRLGIGLYGIDSSKEIQSQLQVVNTLKATVSQLKTIPQGETIGYGRRGIAARTLRIATISIGYADGLLRRAGNGRYSVGVRGALAPIVGGVCMDMTMIDVTDIPGVQEGDEVIVFGHAPTVEVLAEALDTIPYEIFTNTSERVKRVYWQE
jgi:alanine racemase